MQISLSPEVEKLVQQQLKTGRFASADEVIETAVVQFAGHEERAESPAEIEELRAQIALGLSELERGEGAAWDIDDVRAEGQRMLNAGKKQPS